MKLPVAAARTLRIDVYFDLICPWCLIGKSLLFQARDRLLHIEPETVVTVQWHSVQLIPEVPAEGWPFAEFYERRLGSAQAVRTRQAQVMEATARAGSVMIDFASITTFPNTWQAHCLLAQAQAQLLPAAYEALLQRLLEAYFQRGEDLGDAVTLAAIAHQHSLDTNAPPGLPLPTVRGPAGGVPGVPFFVFNGHHGLSGAQAAGALLAAMQNRYPPPQASFKAEKPKRSPHLTPLFRIGSRSALKLKGGRSCLAGTWRVLRADDAGFLNF